MASITQDTSGRTSAADKFPPWDEAGGPRRASPADPPVAGSAAGIRLAAEPPVQARLAAVKAAKNPLLEAAQPLLRILSEMPPRLQAGEVLVFHELLVQEVFRFQWVCTDAQIKHEHIVAGSYALCTAIDEAANSSPWGGVKAGDTTGGAGPWANRQLAEKFHGDIEGGAKVFLLIGRLAANHLEHIDLLELMFYILGLGFKGSYSPGSNPNATSQLLTIRHRLYTIVVAARGDVPVALSPHWQGVGTGRFRLRRNVPVWVTAGLSALVLLCLFGWYKYQLLQLGAQVDQRIRAIGAMQPPAAPLHKSLRLKELLSAEIASGTVNVEEDQARSAVSFRGDDMFVPGQARLNPKILPVLAKVAREINEVSGTVQVTGHSDNQPIRTREFPDNQVLSEKRAMAAAEVLKASGVVPDRLKVEGRGDAVSIADNATAAGRAQNRRVDIVVTQGGHVDRSASVAAPALAASASASQRPGSAR